MGMSWDKAPSSRLGVSYVFTASGSSQATSTFGTQTYQIRVATTSGAIDFTATRPSSRSGRVPGAEFVPFLAFDKEIRTLICTTNAIVARQWDFGL